ncbi:MAG: 50S ribosomal protein L1 [Bdellovibrionaceae bacterium]|nr:50S ribosomal protein L1 [Pseudobdellovibrionaceae bacterium]
MANKRYKESLKKVENDKLYELDSGLKLAIDTATAGFDESIDISAKLGVDAKQADQQVRGAVSLPHGLGKNIRVVVFAKGEKEEEAKKAGADFVGSEDLIEKIKSGWLEFDRVLATPDMMPTVAKIAKILGPKGLMPSPKTGAVTNRIGPSVEAEKKGKASFRVDKNSIIHCSIGKKSMGFEKLKENYISLMEEILKLKPKSSKGTYIRSLSVSATMGPGLNLNPIQAVQKELS